MTEGFDIVIIGSGMGGGTLAYALADTGARILIVERGDFIPQEDENWSPHAVWGELRYRTSERWIDGRGSGVPSLHTLIVSAATRNSGGLCCTATARGLRRAPAPGWRLSSMARYV